MKRTDSFYHVKKFFNNCSSLHVCHIGIVGISKVRKLRQTPVILIPTVLVTPQEPVTLVDHR